MGSKFICRRLPYSVTGDRLQEFFAEHGTVESAQVISDLNSPANHEAWFGDASLRRGPEKKLSIA